jgi:hypothetical protein
MGDHSVDDHSQPNLRARTGSDCSAAECLDPVQPVSELSTTDITPAAPLRPFVWQAGRRLLLLEREMGHWVLAELQFEPEICRYSELRRAFYRWEREAVGALLSRTIAYGEKASTESAELLDIWMRRRR